MSRTLRQIKAFNIKDELPAMIDKETPTFEWVDPTTLYIEGSYQRNLAERSVKLIRTIYKNFSWTRFKPPICSIGEDGKLCVIDGQHTAIAAACLTQTTQLTKIPVMVITAGSVRERASAFMGHNRDRVQVTPSQLYYSSLIAEDASAKTVEKALKLSGCKILRANRQNIDDYEPGETIAAGPLMRLAGGGDDAEQIARVLTILFHADRAPIGGPEINAVRWMLNEKEYRGRFDDKDLSAVIGSKEPKVWQSDAELTTRKGTKMPMSKALGITWFRRVPKKKGPRVKEAEE